jgi:hypothetical protein
MMGYAMLELHAYRKMYGTWRFPADKHVPRRVDPPYGYPKFPPIVWREDWPVVVLVAAMLALGALLRLVTGENPTNQGDGMR